MISLPFLGYDYTKRLEPISVQWYLKKLVVGLILWVPFGAFAFIVPVIGWIFIPLVPIFPFIYPIIERLHISKKQKKMKEQEIVMARAMNRTKAK